MANRSIPRLRFFGDDFAERTNAIFAENLRDLVDKAEMTDNNGGKGFFHTSTNKHEGTCYYDQMWSRDCGRGVIELARFGYIDEATACCRYFLKHLSYNGTHWAREMHNPGVLESTELDGNALILLGFYNTWLMSGKNAALGAEFLEGLEPVLRWCAGEINASAYHGLMGSRSELSGNPGTEYVVYGVFGNYAMYIALLSLAEMRRAVLGSSGELAGLAEKLREGLGHLVSDGKFSKTEEGCFMNGVESAHFTAYDTMEFADQTCEAWHWTRQLVNILNADTAALHGDSFLPVHEKTYDFIRHYMAQGYYFRKYGFVSNTGWTGMGGRHDDTMCGYGQGFFTQAALLSDDVNCYGKCLEGVARLGYDGNVLEHLAHENNPFVMHECFCYENYESALDHTYGGRPGSDPKKTENPGDEGNLVQAAEIVKAFRLVVGAEYDGEGNLTISPRLPWLWSGIEVTDLPVLGRSGKPCRLSFRYRNERHLRASEIEIAQGYEEFDRITVRFGPYPKYIKGVEREQKRDASWISVQLTSPRASVSLDELQDQ